jgi:competence protein CoiA
MQTALFNNKKVYANEIENSITGCFCSCCNQPVIFKKGAVKIAHFAHKSISNCPLSENESEEHLFIKTSIYNSLKKYSFIENLEMEKYLKESIADIYYEKNGIKYAIEIQLSNLTREKIAERVNRYNNRNIHVLWVHSYEQFLNRIDLISKTISLKDWEKWLTIMNYGKLYLWKKEDKIIPVSFSKINLSNGEESKRTRKIKSEEIKSIALDSFGVIKEEWNNFPEAKIIKFKK